MLEAETLKLETLELGTLKIEPIIIEMKKEKKSAIYWIYTERGLHIHIIWYS